MTAQPSRIAAGTDWIAVAIVVASGIIAALQVGKGVIALPALRNEFGLDLAAAGWVLSIFAVLGVVGGIPTGMAVAWFGDRRLLALGLLAMAAGSALGGLADGFTALLATRALEGLGFLLVSVAGPALLQRIAAADDRDLAMGIWGTYMAAGMAVALLVGTPIGGWRGLWFADAVLAGVIFVLLFPLVPRAAQASANPVGRGMLGDVVLTATSAGPLLLAASFMLYNLMYFALVGFLPVLLEDRLGVPTATAGILSAIAVGANALGNLAAGWLLGRGAARWILVAVACGVMAVSGVAIFAAALPALSVFLLCVLFSTVAGLLPASVIGAASLAAPQPHLAAMVVGLIIQGSNLGQVIAPVVVGSAVDAAGWSAAAIPVAIVGGLGIVAAVGLRGVFGRREA